MPTDNQRYSTENQTDAIAAYAAQRNLSIVQTYEDKGRSGLRFEGRAALQALIADILDRRADFGVILVYDVSRWERFQDIDESAYYEFMCKAAGIKVLYCAETFENDGSFISSIAKTLKLAGAADFSRELSITVFTGQLSHTTAIRLTPSCRRCGKNCVPR
jgi:DNA invertase Pin-like site-specific DNA recombinase